MIATGHNYVENILAAAQRYNMSVILGNADVPWVDQGGQQSWKMQAALSKAILAELWGLYGQTYRRTIGGFYNVVELSCSTRNQAISMQIAKDMFGPFSRRSNPSTPRSARSRPPTTASRTHRTRTTTRCRPRSMPPSGATSSLWAPHFDTVAPQDGMGAGGNTLATVHDYLSALRGVTRALGRTLWSNVELFTKAPHCALAAPKVGLLPGLVRVLAPGALGASRAGCSTDRSLRRRLA